MPSQLTALMKLTAAQIRALLELAAKNRPKFLEALKAYSIAVPEFDSLAQSLSLANAKAFFRGIWPE
jgi:hypothetical protein